MCLQPLDLKDKAGVERYLKKERHFLSAYAFESLFSWRSHFEVLGATINKKLCLFYKGPTGCFMALPPLGGLDVKTLDKCFDIMEGMNRNKDISRIENIEERDLVFFKKNGFRVYEKSREYIVRTRQMAELKGDRFKHKRNLVNFFKKNNAPAARAYEDKDKPAVLELYTGWKSAREKKNSDSVYVAMLEDSFKSLSVFLDDYKRSDAQARVVECGGAIRAFTSGFPVSPALFCVNFEFADSAFKGIAQFIFNAFAAGLLKYPEINMMDDSGMENIRYTKLSYKPSRIVSSYTALLAA
ncbi:MAG TPA: hypothetical protein DCL35_01375 [Candidatus Omnitrophica bacterium]|nr:hypothetical protein [Candidatus Omnitrophota bacterium]